MIEGISCPKCKRYKHACHCAEVEAATAELRAEADAYRVRCESANVIIIRYRDILAREFPADKAEALRQAAESAE